MLQEVDDFQFSQDLFADVDQTISNGVMGGDEVFRVAVGGAASLDGFSIGPSNIVYPLDLPCGSFNGFQVNDSDLTMSPNFLQHFTDSDASMRHVYNNEDLLNANQLVSTRSIGDSGRPDFIFRRDYVANGSPNANATCISHENDVNFPECLAVPDTENVAFDNWGGRFNFKATPVVDGKKGLFLVEMNKLYCKPNTAVPFKFEMNFSEIENLDLMDHLTIRAFLVFKDSDYVKQPVLRCAQHIEEEKKITDESNKERLVHFLRPRDSDLKYFLHPKSSRCYLLAPLKYPEPGMSFVTRNFCFACLNSCTTFGMEGKSRRSMAMLFYLYDNVNGEVLARQHVDIRVCSAPTRDCNKEVSAGIAKNRKRKCQEGETATTVLPSPKQIHVGMGEVPLFQLPGSSAAMPTNQPTIRNVVRAGKVEDDGVSSSQETVYSCDESAERINLRELVKDIRWVLKSRQSGDPRLSNYSKDVYSALRLTQSLCNSARDWDLKLKDNASTSPDGGFHDVA